MVSASTPSSALAVSAAATTRWRVRGTRRPWSWSASAMGARNHSEGGEGDGQGDGEGGGEGGGEGDGEGDPRPSACPSESPSGLGSDGAGCRFVLSMAMRTLLENCCSLLVNGSLDS